MKQLKRFFLNINNVEVEVCQDQRGIYFVRHHLYWSITHRKKNPDPERDCVITHLEWKVNQHLKTVKWAGYQFKFETVCFDDEMEVNTVLIPLDMFEELIKFESKYYGEPPPDNECTRLGGWLKDNSLKEYVNQLSG